MIDRKYQDFLSKKEIIDHPSGFEVSPDSLNKNLFDWQKVLVKWSLIRGRAALFVSTGLGKTIMQLEWARNVNLSAKEPVIILTPLAVSEQTRAEGVKFGIESKIVSSEYEIVNGINITNYEKMHKFNVSKFAGVVLDESSILKCFSGATRTAIINSFSSTPYRLSCTATPAPNDYTELGNQAEFLGVMSHMEMKSAFFVNDSGDTGKWRMKGHVQNNVFWKWLSSWAVIMEMPSDLGFSDDGFQLPPINYHEHIIKSKSSKRIGLFLEEAGDLNSRRKIRRDTINARCEAASKLINDSSDRWLIWCNLNDEGTLLAKTIDEAVEVAGRHTNDYKVQQLLGFAAGDVRRLVSKPEIAGWGMNFQICNKAAFVGMNDSWESIHQATRRIWRYGQKNKVDIHIFLEEREGPVLRNIQRKENQYRCVLESVKEHILKLTRKEISSSKRTEERYKPNVQMRIPSWLISK